MEVRIWGARGSYPASGARFSQFGHHTACVSLAHGDDLVVLDAGSGAAALGEALRKAPVRRLHVLLSHFHQDHLMGLPFLLYGAGQEAQLSIHAAFGVDFPLGDVIGRLFSAPYFPDEAQNLLGRVSYNGHQPGAGFAAGDIGIRTAPVEHSGGATAFRLESAGRSVVYVTDIEESREPDAGLLALVHDADILFHDTMFTKDEIETRRGWGHSTIEAAAILARKASVKQLVGLHHNPMHDDRTLLERERDLASQMPGAFLAREGQVILL
jgi:ribonuclease BN (tRNA processing enzyme)